MPNEQLNTQFIRYFYTNALTIIHTARYNNFLHIFAGNNLKPVYICLRLIIEMRSFRAFMRAFIVAIHNVHEFLKKKL